VANDVAPGRVQDASFLLFGPDLIPLFWQGAAMDLGDITQLVVVATTALVLGRVGLAFARLIEHRASSRPTLTPETEDRLRALEGECSTLRQELTEVQERQDFTERALLQSPGQARPTSPPARREKIVTPR
jgi:hypothetical protein